MLGYKAFAKYNDKDRLGLAYPSRLDVFFDNLALCMYNTVMQYAWDSKKNAINQAKHGLSFENATHFVWQQATHEVDDREDYGELRIVSFAPLRGRICALLWTPRGDIVRIIGLRKANPREVKRYENKA